MADIITSLLGFFLKDYVHINGLSAVKNPVNIINFVHRIIPEEIQPETIAV
jgi:hypothetical protein